VSDLQIDISHTDHPNLTDDVKDEGPKLEPNAVKTEAPVAATFPRRVELKPDICCDMIPVKLPYFRPELISTRMHPENISVTLQARDVSDTHNDCSEADTPDLAANVKDVFPMLAPCTVTRTDPVAALFPGSKVLATAKSTDMLDDTVPVTMPILTLTSLLVVNS
jgi:hypothetical protein